MKRTEKIRLSLLVLPALISGCAVGPNYKQPQTSVAASFANRTTNAVTADEATLATWWKGFNDPKLDALIEQAIAATLQNVFPPCLPPVTQSYWNSLRFGHSLNQAAGRAC